MKATAVVHAGRNDIAGKKLEVVVALALGFEVGLGDPRSLVPVNFDGCSDVSVKSETFENSGCMDPDVNRTQQRNRGKCLCYLVTSFSDSGSCRDLSSPPPPYSRSGIEFSW